VAEDSGDKRHAPTERRLRQAAEKGQVRRSADLPKAAAIVFAVTIALNAAAVIGAQLNVLFASFLATAGTGNAGLAAGWTGAAEHTLMPLLFLIAGVSLASSFLSGGWVFALQALAPDLSKLLPQHGLGQVFSSSGLIETCKSVLKFVMIGGVATIMMVAGFPDFAALGGPSDPNGGALLALCLHILTAVCVAVGLLAAADVALQFWMHRQKLRMTDNEIREEMKEAVGNPHVKQRQRAIARRMARARQMRRIPEASVVVTNPTHFAVAIRYRRGTDGAPLLLAKGVGLLAQEIIATARGLGIPIVESPPLARAVYRYVEPGDPVPVALYRACAEVLAYVWRLQQWRAAGGARPAAPKPAKLDVDESGRFRAQQM
jgi:flagellar biosynthetic protein FlhB